MMAFMRGCRHPATVGPDAQSGSADAVDLGPGRPGQPLDMALIPMRTIPNAERM